jgi:hypothetical protein
MKIIIIITIALLLIHVTSSSASAQVLINEVHLNTSGNSSQWVELYNTGDEDVNITSWSIAPLSDPTKERAIDQFCRLPADPALKATEDRTLSPRGFFVLEAPAEEEGTKASWLLTREETLILRDREGAEVDRTPILRDLNRSGCSWGRYPDGSPNWDFMISTKGGPNSGEKPFFCIEGYVLNDFDGVFLAGWRIILRNAAGLAIATARTDKSGQYRFCDLLPGTYTLCEIEREGWRSLAETCIEVELKCQDVIVDDFVNVPLSCIKGRTIHDFDGKALPGWTIVLKDAAGTEISRNVTDKFGEYKFCDLVPSTYTVCEEVREGWTNVIETCIEVDLEYNDVAVEDLVNVPVSHISDSNANVEPDEGDGEILLDSTTSIGDVTRAGIGSTTSATTGSG